jgi:signal transduction histidine kinase
VLGKEPMDVIARQRRTFPYITMRLLVFALAYLIACGYGFYFRQSAAAPLWFPDSVLLCALLLTPPKSWWIYLAIAVPIRFIPTSHPDVPLWFRFATCANDLLKGTLVAYLLRRLLNASTKLTTMRQLATFLGVAVVFIPALSAVVGAFTRQLLGYQFWVSFHQWFLGDALANLVLTPALLYWCLGNFRTVTSPILELGIWVAGFLISLQLALSLTHSTYAPIAFCILVPSLIWAATRFRPIGASTALSVIALLATVRIIETGNLFSTGLESSNLLFFQLFLLVVSVPVLCVAVLIEERGSVEKNLRETQRELEKLPGRLIKAQEEERQRIARELHDDYAQRLAIVAIELEDLGGKVEASSVEVRQQFSELFDQISDLGADLHSLSHRLHSSTLESLGLVAGLRSLCNEFSRQNGLQVEFAHENVPSGVAAETALCVFRVAQEALRNIKKHSGASRADVRLEWAPEELHLSVSDRGSGFDSSKPSDGIGIQSMEERLRLQGGRLEIQSTSWEGSRVDAWLPVNDASQATRSKIAKLGQ